MNKQGILPSSSASVIPRLPGTTMARMTAPPATTLFWVAGLVRIVLIVYGEWHDSHMEVPYTDIDYRVFSDAAGFMAEGKSPYMRDTYRYSPLLALILLPNSWLHRCWGKALFSVADLLVGVLIRECLLLRGVSKKKSEACAATWLFNPFTCTVATRGNCEALVSAILLWLVICLMQGRLVQAAVWYGFLVHFRIYPIIYAISILLLLDNEYSGTETDSSAPGGKSALRLSALRVFLRRVITKERLVFGLVSGGIFLGLTSISYLLYGYHFLHEALLYHLTRTDPRHNFSIYFYHIYLHYEVDFTILERLMSFIPQMAVQLILAANFSRDLPFCIFAQTVAFVAFNKVITAQYFVWFFCLLPLILPMTTLKLRWKGLGCVGLWLSTQLHWLAWAYLLEFRGRNVFLPIWIASLVFFAANVVVLGFIIGHHSYSPLFHRGNLLCAGASVNTIKQS